MSSSLPKTALFLLPRLGSFSLLLVALFAGTIAIAGSPMETPTESRPTSVDGCLSIEAMNQNESPDACQNELVTLIVYETGLIPSSQPGSGQARKAAPGITYTWTAPAGASLNTYTGDEVIASFTTSGPKEFTVVGTDGVCSGTATVIITANPIPEITIFFPNSLSIVPISGEQPTVTQITLPNTIQATQGVLYEWHVVIDRINGYEIRQGDTNGTGIFQVGQVGPYVLTVTGSNGCKRTVRGTLVLAPGGGGN